MSGNLILCEFLRLITYDQFIGHPWSSGQADLYVSYVITTASHGRILWNS